MNKNEFRGLQNDEVVDKSRVRRDDRAFTTIAWDALSNEGTYPILAIVVALVLWFAPIYWEALIPFLFLYFFISARRRNEDPDLPNYLPHDSGFKEDRRIPKLGSLGRKFEKPEADWFIGLDRETGKQIWHRIKDMLVHIMILGITGSGKTELIMNIIATSLGSGAPTLMFTDPKADAKTISKIAWLAHRHCREDDLRFLNYIQPAERDVTMLDYTATNSINPTQEGNEHEVSNILVSLSPTVEGGNNASFASNSINLSKSVSACLVDLRNKEVMSLNWTRFRESMTLDGCLRLAHDERLSDHVREAMHSFIYSIAGVEEGKSIAEQSSTAREQFGYVVSYLTRGLSTLTNVFGFIYDHEYGDVSYLDTIQRGRIVGSMIPSLQNTPEDTSMIGKIDLAGKKQAMSYGLPTQMEGTNREIKLQDVTSSGGVSLNIVDEFRYVATEGIEISATQARFLQIGSLFAGQSTAGFSVISKEQKDEIVGNTDTKFLGRAKDPETIKEFSAMMGQQYVAETDGRDSENSPFGGSYDRYSMSYHMRDAIHELDIAKQRQGQWHMLVEDRLIRAEVLYIKTPYDDDEWENPELAFTLFNNFVNLPIISREALGRTQAQTQLMRDLFLGDAEPRFTNAAIFGTLDTINEHVDDDSLAAIMSLMDLQSELEDIEVVTPEAVNVEQSDITEGDGGGEGDGDKEPEYPEANLVPDIDELEEPPLDPQQELPITEATQAEIEAVEDARQAERIRTMSSTDILDDLFSDTDGFEDVGPVKGSISTAQSAVQKHAAASRSKKLQRSAYVEKNRVRDKHLREKEVYGQTSMLVTEGEDYAQELAKKESDRLDMIATELLESKGMLKGVDDQRRTSMIFHATTQLRQIQLLKSNFSDEQRYELIKERFKKYNLRKS